MGSLRGFSSCDEAQLWGWTRNDLLSAWSAGLTFGRSRLGVKFGFDPLFIPCSEHLARSIRVFDVGSGIRGRSPVLLWCVTSLFVSASKLQSWHRYPSPCRLRSATWSLFYLVVVFLGVLGTVTHPSLVDCSLRSHHRTRWGSDNGCLCFFAQEERIHAKLKLVLVSHLLDVSILFKRRNVIQKLCTA